MWGSLTSYYGLFLSLVGLLWILETRGMNVPFWPGSLLIPDGIPLIGGGYVNWLGALFFIMGAVSLFGAWRAPRKISYILEDQVVRIRKGRPWRTKQETEVLKRNISKVEVSQTILQKVPFTPMGTVIIRSLLDPEGEPIMEKVRHPKQST